MEAARMHVHDDNEAEPMTLEQRVAGRRVINTALRFWIACPTKRCQRWRKCAGDPARCWALFWPVVPPEVKAWLRAMAAARRKGRSLRQAMRLAEGARSVEAFRQHNIAALEGRLGQAK
jgi:hypothetical protein